MPVRPPDLWSITSGRPHIDPAELAEAVRRQAGERDLDFRTRLLIRDSVGALQKYWGSARFDAWLQASPARDEIERISRADLGPPGFPYLASRVMEPTRPDDILQYFRDLGRRLPQPVSMAVGGSVALIVGGSLSRATDDIDVVDEIPAALRSDHDLLDGLARRYGLHLTHFQSHYLPTGWRERLRLLDRFGRLDVHLVDIYDVALSKLFSRRDKDLDDLRVLTRQLDNAVLLRRLTETTAAFRADPRLTEAAEGNWYVLFGEPLPP